MNGYKWMLASRCGLWWRASSVAKLHTWDLYRSLYSCECVSSPWGHCSCLVFALLRLYLSFHQRYANEPGDKWGLLSNFSPKYERSHITSAHIINTHKVGWVSRALRLRTGCLLGQKNKTTKTFPWILMTKPAICENKLITKRFPNSERMLAPLWGTKTDKGKSKWGKKRHRKKREDQREVVENEKNMPWRIFSWLPKSNGIKRRKIRGVTHSSRWESVTEQGDYGQNIFWRWTSPRGEIQPGGSRIYSSCPLTCPQKGGGSHSIFFFNSAFTCST